jgi:dimethylhistidine N-methyltransferase
MRDDMPVIAPDADNVFFEDQQPAPSDSRAELLAGLQRSQKQVNPKYFYDARGSELFEQITQLHEYYPTRTETEILTSNAAEIARCCGSDCVLIEPGSGSSEKVRLLLDAVKPAAYVPLDISAEFLRESALKLGQEFPWLSIYSICADFSDQWQMSDDLPAGRRVVFYPGSTIGNMEPRDAQIFLAGLRDWIGEDGGVLIGVDLQKSKQLLDAAYNDSQGITAEFNLNILNVINSHIDTDLNADDFSHQAFYNQELKRIEMHLVSNSPQVLQVNDVAIEIAQGETLHTENSYKYSLESFTALSEAAGFDLQQSWLDEDRLFSVHYLTVTQA